MYVNEGIKERERERMCVFMGGRERENVCIYGGGGREGERERPLFNWMLYCCLPSWHCNGIGNEWRERVMIY